MRHWRHLLGPPEGGIAPVPTRAQLRKLPCAGCGRRAWIVIGPPRCSECDHGQAAERDLAYLRDRVDMDRGRPQLHGTQFLGHPPEVARLWPVTDPAMVNDRRRALGFPPLDDATLAGAWTSAELADQGRPLDRSPRPQA